MIAMTVIYVAYFTLFLQTFTTLPLMMTADGHGPATYGAVLALNGIAIVLLQPLAVRILDGRDSSAVLAVSMLLVGVGAGFGAITNSSAGYAVSVLILTFGEIGIAVMFGAIFADIAPVDLRGRYMGVASTTWSIGDRARASARHPAARPGRTIRAGNGVCDHRDGSLRRPAGACAGAAPPNRGTT